MVVRTPWQFGNRSENDHNKDLVLPQLKVPHPSSRLGDPQSLNLRGVSRQNAYGHTEGTNFPGIPDGVQVIVGEDRSKVRIPIFGNAANISERIESRLSTARSSRLGTANSATVSTSCGETKLSTAEIVRLIRDKMKTGYYTMKNIFLSYDQNEKGFVSRDSFRRILSTFLQIPLTYSQYNRLLKSYGFSDVKEISYNQFYGKVKEAKPDNTEYPDFFHKDQQSTEQNHSASYVHTKLCGEATNSVQNVLSNLDLLGVEYIIKPAFQDSLANVGYKLTPLEFDKLWRKYDSKNTGIVSIDVFIGKLQRSQSKSPDDAPASAKLKLQNAPLEKQLLKKFREISHDMYHAFKEFSDDENRVTRDQFLLVLREYGIILEESDLDDLLARYNVRYHKNGLINFQEFLTAFHDQKLNGDETKLRDKHITYGNVNSRKGTNQNSRCGSNTGVSFVEAKLFKLLQTEHSSLLNKCRKLDQGSSNTLSQVQFQAALESFFRTQITKDQYDTLLASAPKNDKGDVKYIDLLNNFQKRGSKAVETCSSILTNNHLNEIDDVINGDVIDDSASSISIDSCREDRNIEQLSLLIKHTIRQKFQLIEKAFFELDEKNTKRMTKDKLRKLLHRAGLKISRTECDIVWTTLLTDQRGTLEYQHFVRHFGHSKKSAAFPNAKVSPPTRGDSDFRVLSNRFNSWKDLMQDFAKVALENSQPLLKAKFEQVDTEQHGFVTTRQFKNVLQSVCYGLSNSEIDIIIDKFSSAERIFWPEFLKQLRPNRIMSRQGHNMKDIMQHKSFTTINEAMEEESNEQKLIFT